MNHREVFSIHKESEFNKIALKVFKLQVRHNSIYKQYVSQLGVDQDKVKRVEQIPFLPIEFFKTRQVLTKNKTQSAKNKKTFLSSGTSGMQRSRHHVADIKLYESSFRNCFERFYGDMEKYYILAFLPSYYENKNSSLLYMVNDLMKKSGKKESRFYKNSEQKILVKVLEKLLSERKKVILFAVSYALLDLSPSWRGLGGGPVTRDLIILETGGMKGRREEITREELHKILCKKFGVKKIHSEYGMTELLSQAYSKGDGIFDCPPWMKVFIRDANDPFSFLSPGKTGAINIIDLANIHSCAFIATQDVGRVQRNGSFEVLGRMDNSDLRGCNLLAG